MVDVSSETGRLRRVIVHEPGAEVDRMVPSMMGELLFDDIIYGDHARDEHARFRRVLQLCGVEVLEANDLLVEALADPEAQDWVIDVLLRELSRDDRRQLREMTGEELVEKLVAGSRPRTRPRGAEVEDLFMLPPLANWCFQRDPQIVLGHGVAFSAMAAAARHREALLARATFRFHPSLRTTPVIFDPLDADRDSLLLHDRVRLEGGDVLVLSPDIVAVGLSQRTSKPAVRELARALARRVGGPRWLIAVAIPKRRAYMHLDTLFTPVDRNACLIHAPVLLDGATEPAEVYEFDLDAGIDQSSYRPETFLQVLAGHGLDLEPISCGGADPISQQREQWTDGANALAVAPGVITMYARNTATADELARHGFRIIEAEDLLLGGSEIDPDDGTRACILLASHEMSRARGGPHCLTHPLQRDPL